MAVTFSHADGGCSRPPHHASHDVVSHHDPDKKPMEMRVQDRMAAIRENSGAPNSDSAATLAVLQYQKIMREETREMSRATTVETHGAESASSSAAASAVKRRRCVGSGKKGAKREAISKHILSHVLVVVAWAFAQHVLNTC